ncbi:MAG TPA: DUF523 domain-containing protein [Oscillospiraceae bacterium]|nr:DUF523 domain-containing protein [Oscillospiraceae bacterium]
MPRKVILVSACLLGLNTKYDGTHNCRPEVLAWQEQVNLIPVCPEQLGGLSTPRSPTEIQDGDGHAVLKGAAEVKTAAGGNCTDAFRRGAEEVWQLAQVMAAAGALLKARSPSCGSGYIYNGSFTGQTKAGDGVTAALLKINGLPVFTEEEPLQFKQWLENGDS